MRGGSRSGMACAFVRFASQQMAQDAIDAIHGRITLPHAAEPLVVRWADAPGSRRREGREGGRGKRNNSGGGGNAHRDLSGGVEGWPPPMLMGNGMYGGAYPPMMMAQMGAPGHMTPQGIAMQQAALGAAQYGTPPYYGQGVPGAGSYANGGMLPQPMGGPYGQQQMMVYMEQGGMGGQQFWQTPPSPQQSPMHAPPQQMNGLALGAIMAPLSPNRPDVSGGGPQANGYPGMRPAEAAPLPIATGPGPGMM